ncbi:hypothetical protein ACFVIM_20440 [Streptomyces sp. NPDC057638]|uniref:hypothetical protein n=1 Tax=Streptomyces sp. NPDC057638 TaxID=3346190 RepID=UPI00369AF1AC
MTSRIDRDARGVPDRPLSGSDARPHPRPTGGVTPSAGRRAPGHPASFVRDRLTEETDVH